MIEGSNFKLLWYKPYNHIPHSKSNKREQGDVGVNDIN